MKVIEIKKGERESAPLTLAHWSLSSIFSPKFDTKVTVFGSFDGTNFGPMKTFDGKAITFVSDIPSVIVFNADDFLGVQFIKFVLDTSASRNLTFSVHIKDR